MPVVMAARGISFFKIWSRWLPLAVGFSVLVLHVPAQTSTASGKPFVYDVVSVKPHKLDSGTGLTMWWRYTKDGLSAQGVTLVQLMIIAYGVLTPDQIEGLPSWSASTQFSIDAKMDDDTVARFQKLSQADRGSANREMLQGMLADRFQLKAHHENRERPVYELVIAKGGVKLKETAAGESGGYSMGNGKLSGKGIQISSLTFSLSNEVGRYVVDKTGLTGKYDMDLKWTPDDEQGSADAGPSIFTALEEQLGLKLVAAKGPVDTVVVDHIEKPSEN
jgi:uncharacterized protein (TIGR03435 family)